MSIHDHHRNHSANQGLRCRTESTHSAEVSGAQPGQHSRVLVSSLNTVEDVPVFGVSAVHGRILWKQSACDHMVKSSIQCWELKISLKDSAPQSIFGHNFGRWSFDFCLNTRSERGLVLRGRFSLGLLISRTRMYVCAIQGMEAACVQFSALVDIMPPLVALKCTMSSNWETAPCQQSIRYHIL